MLTYRLTSTTGDIGVDHDEHGKSEPNHTGTATLERHRIFAHHGAPRRRRRVADLHRQPVGGFFVPARAIHCQSVRSSTRGQLSGSFMMLKIRTFPSASSIARSRSLSVIPPHLVRPSGWLVPALVYALPQNLRMLSSFVSEELCAPPSPTGPSRAGC